MHRGLVRTIEPNMDANGEILMGEGAGVHNVDTPITGWDTRKDKVYSKVKQSGITCGTLHIQTKRFIEPEKTNDCSK